MVESLNYTNWKNDHKTILETLSDKKVLLLFTGGKDCSVILHYLLIACKEFGFNFETHSVRYPNHVFTDTEIKKLDTYWRSRNVDIIWHKLNETDSLFSKAEKDGINPCYICHETKRSFFKNSLKTVEENNKEIFVIISYTLWDLVSYSIEYLLGGIYKPIDNNKTSKDKSPEDRFIETSQRFYPLLKLKDGLTIFKPLLKYNDYEIIKIVTEEKIPLSTVECKYKKFRPKRILSDYYKQMNLTFNYNEVLKFAEKSLKLHKASLYTELDKFNFIKNIL